MKGSKTTEDATEELMNTFNLSLEQTKAVLDMRMQRLVGLEVEKLNEELASLKRDIADYENILKHENRKYEISGEKDNILTKSGTNGQWMGTICENELQKGEEHKWKIKILNTTKLKRIMVGVAPIDFDINASSYDNCGWYLNLYSGSSTPILNSGSPHNYNAKKQI